MASDYPDNMQLFYLTGVAITIPINIESSDITLPISIDAVTAELSFTLAASDITLPISLDAVNVTLDVNIESQDANITFEFADQSVAVFDAAAWFAHQGSNWSIFSEASKTASGQLAVTRIVPANKVAYLLGIGVGYFGIPAAFNIYWSITVAGNVAAVGGFAYGGAVVFDVPFRATAGQALLLTVTNWSGATIAVGGSFWGYDEAA